jgi:hypothetical protein
MAQHNLFIIHNDLPNALTLNIEPEGAYFPLGRGEEVFVREAFTTAPVTVKFTVSAQGDPIVSIWPGDGEVHVEKDGVNVFDLLQRASPAASQQLGLPAFTEPVRSS